MHAVCHETTDRKFGSCTAMSSSSPVIEALKLVTVKIESVSDSISTIEHASIDVAYRLCTHCIDDLLPYYTPLATGDVVKCFVHYPK